MTIKLNIQDAYGSGLPVMPVRHLTGGALALRIEGIPARISGSPVAEVALNLTNADGIEVGAICDFRDGAWTATFAASNFASYGTVKRGLRISADTDEESDIMLGAADLVIEASSADAVPGDPAAHYAVMGGDIYLKTQVVDGVQHYTKQTMAYDPDIGWGAEWSGDYILTAGGEFVEVH